VKLDDDEPQADVRAKQALVESAQLALTEARRYLGEAEKLIAKGALSQQRYHEIRAAALKVEKDHLAAKAALDSAKAELEHYEITSAIDGVVSWLKVHPGTVPFPGKAVWGEVLDLREIDVRCELTFEQVNRVSTGQAAEIRKLGAATVFGTGRVVFVGISADGKSERVPVHVRLVNRQEQLRCDEPVQVRFIPSRAISEAR
jgi:multidrug efflux pump subunit AcrA (membrane-fusion protein)